MLQFLPIDVVLSNIGIAPLQTSGLTFGVINKTRKADILPGEVE